MAHFARIKNGIVTQVIVISNDDAPDPYPASEALGQAFIATLGLTGECGKRHTTARSAHTMQASAASTTRPTMCSTHHSRTRRGRWTTSGTGRHPSPTPTMAASMCGMRTR